MKSEVSAADMYHSRRCWSDIFVNKKKNKKEASKPRRRTVEMQAFAGIAFTHTCTHMT